ncbi:DUF3533 domain-containing protein [Mycena venus]|uniref:DUF3533 domain-containing protein n=1 Tax=Mycena venus TaxID=2733690 RepID=A0A8H6XIJ0_9AGAR|nr:DUF3533 domain-containing protein [Mycena venus]
MRAAQTHTAMEKLDRSTSPAASEATVHDVLPISPVPFSTQFLDKTPEAGAARAIYLKTLVGGVGALAVVIFAVFSIYWGSVWSTPHHTLPGWIVDFDGGAVGQAVSAALSGINPGTNGVVWQVVPASQFPGGISELQHAIVQEKTWYAVTINSGTSDNLSAAVSAADSTYNSSLAVTFIGSEARNENIYRVHSRIVTGQLEAITHQFTLQFLKNISSSPNVATLLSTAPQLVSRPIYYTSDNLHPFDVSVASAVTFVGLIYLLILSFFIVMVSTAAREISGLEKNLTLSSLIRVRIATSFIAYFFISLFYTLLSRAFQLPFDRNFGSAGLVIFWMLNWIGMLACGLALDAMITLLTARFIPFFLIIWIISNVSVSVFPLQVLPHVYHYGYAFPFYNISRAVRSIIFSTKNDVGMNFGILIAWVALSCITLTLFQWFMRRRLAVTQGKTLQI